MFCARKFFAGQRGDKRLTHGSRSYPSLLLLIDRKRGLSEEAISLLKRSIELDRNLGEAYSLLASMHADAGRVKEAEMLHVKALQVAPWNADFINNYAVFLQSKGICTLSSQTPLWFQPFPPTLLSVCHYALHTACVIFSLSLYL